MTTGTSSIVQVRPNELIDLLTADFQRRAEPQFAWKSAISSFLALPGLRGFWPMSSAGYTAADQARDLTGQGNHLTNNNTVTFGYNNLAPYAAFVSGSSQYLSRADGGASNWADTIGTESYIVSGQRGLTIGGWFYLTASGAMGLIGKYHRTDQRSYLLYKESDDDLVFYVSTDGIAVVDAVGPEYTDSSWLFIVGRFIPSTALGIYVNGTWYTETTGVPATLHNGTADFNVGAYENGTVGFMSGRASMCFLCASALSNAIVNQLYEQSRVMFGVLA